MDHTLDARLADVAERHHGVFTHDLVVDLGFSKRQRARRLQEGRWRQLHQGVYRFAGAPITWRGELLAACLAGGTSAVGSHRSGAAIWDLPGADRQIQELICPRWTRSTKPTLVVHETKILGPADTTVVDAIPVTTVERTLLDLGAVRAPATVERAVEAALRQSLTTIDALEATVRRLGRRGRNGAGVLRTILELRNAGRALTESDMELRLLQALRSNGLPEPVTQYEIRHRWRFVARVDAAFVEWRIAIEYESFEHHTGRQALVRDSARRNAIVAAGWMPISVTWNDLRAGGTRVCASILAARRVA